METAPCSSNNYLDLLVSSEFLPLLPWKQIYLQITCSTYMTKLDITFENNIITNLHEWEITN